MRLVLALTAVAALIVACSSLPMPGVGSGIPATCADNLTEATCVAVTHCRWVQDAKRTDGTYATAHCTKE